MAKKGLIISIIVFLVVALFALYLVLNKGYIGKTSLVSINPTTEGEQEIIKPKLTLEFEKEYLSSKNKKDSSEVTITIDGEIVTQGVKLESSDEDIVKINEDNELIPVSDGKATVRATYDGIEASKDIRVITPIKTMTFTTTNSTVRVGKDLQMKLKVTPSDAYIDTLTYKSSDESIATVDNSGIVTGVSAGKVTITVYDSYTETEKSVNLTIRK